MTGWYEKIKNRHHVHCELSSFMEFFSIAALIISGIIFFKYNSQFAQNLIVLFGLSTLGGGIGILWYMYANKKWIFK